MYILIPLFLWLLCFYLNKDGRIHPSIGGGCFGGSQPEYRAPAAPKLPTAEELWASAVQMAREQFPEAYGARESALSDLELGPEYYARFSPTSFEEALGNQYFKNVWPDTEAKIRHNLSLSGQANRDFSPQLASLTGQAYGNLATNIGQYLSDLGNTRAQYSLASRLGIDPMAMLTPNVQSGLSQSQAQGNLDWEAAQAAAMAEYQNQLAKAKQSSGLFGLGGTVGGGLLGAGLGALLAAPTGGMSMLAGAGYGGLGGATFGGMLGNQLGGGYSSSPLSMRDALSMYRMFSPSAGGWAMPGFQGYGAGTPFGTYNTGSYSILPANWGE